MSKIIDTGRLATAIENGKVILVYQGIVCTITRKIKSYECLLRIIDNRGIISAGPYIEQSEQDGSFLNLGLDELVLSRVVQELRENSNLILSMNISNLSIADGKWLKLAKELLQDQEIANRLIIEITETGSFCNFNHIRDFIAKLKDLGCKVALDDFGTGIFSEGKIDIHLINQLGVDIIKIDGDYIHNIAYHKESRDFVKNIIDVANQYQIQTIAEYVTDAAIACMLRTIGIHYMQGYYYCEPHEKPWLKYESE